MEKTTISNAREQALSEFEHVDCVEPYVKGPQLDQVIVEALIHDGLDAALLQLLRWVHYLVANGLEVKDKNDLYNSTLKPGFFDCNPRNLIVTAEGLQPIDLEWRYLKPLSLRTALLLYLKPFARIEATLLERHFKGRSPLHLQLLSRMGVDFTRRQFRESTRQRRAINRLITASNRTERKRESATTRRPSLIGNLRKWVLPNRKTA